MLPLAYVNIFEFSSTGRLGAVVAVVVVVVLLNLRWRFGRRRPSDDPRRPPL
jgi:hypothetical protein